MKSARVRAAASTAHVLIVVKWSQLQDLPFFFSHRGTTNCTTRNVTLRETRGRVVPETMRAAFALARLCTRPRSLCTRARDASDRAASLGAYGAKGTKGSGLSLIGSRGRGALTAEQLAALERGELVADLDLEAGDVLMEVLAEDHRHGKRNLEFLEGGDGAHGANDGKDDDAPLGSGPKVAHRQYLTNAGVGPGTQYQRQQAAQRQRLEIAESNSFDYRMPKEVKAAREHERRSRAKMREHDVIENRIQEAMATGAFDNLAGAGKPLSREENVFEQISGDAMVRSDGHPL